MKDKISMKKCKEQVRAMGYMFGLFYYHFAKTLVDELGEDEGTRLILKAVWNYGLERGRRTRDEVHKRGLELTVENFHKFSDLPELGWDTNDEGVTYCPYAEPWIEKGAEELGKLYCEVDIAKLAAFNPKIKMVRLKSVLDKQTCCQYQTE